jgi:HSP20 family protein
MFELVPFKRNSNSIAKRGDSFDNLWNSFFNEDFFAPIGFNSSSFKVDIKEEDNNYTLEAELPGFKKEAIALDYDNNYLTISAVRDDSVETKGDNYVKKERSYGKFQRSFYINNIDEAKIDAAFNDGILKVVLPKKEGSVSTKKIDIK